MLEGCRRSVESIAISHDSTRLASRWYDLTVRIWDAGSGDCLQTLNIGKALRDIAFGTTSSYLHTNIGTIALNTPLASNMPVNEIEPQIHDIKA